MSEDDYTDARDEMDDAEEFSDHQDHDGLVEGCEFCEMEREALDAELAIEGTETLNALIAVFVMEPTAQDREAARNCLLEDPFARVR